MQERAALERIQVLERKVDAFEEIPGRMGALEGRMGALEERLGSVEGRLGSVEGRLGSVEGRLGSVEGRLGSVEAQVVQLRNEMRVEFSAVRAERQEGDDETRRLMRVLHEDVVARIAVLQEGRRPRKKN